MGADQRVVAALMGGTVVTEAVFTYPGLGRLLIQAISTRNFPLISTVAVPGS